MGGNWGPSCRGGSRLGKRRPHHFGARRRRTTRNDGTVRLGPRIEERRWARLHHDAAQTRLSWRSRLIWRWRAHHRRRRAHDRRSDRSWLRTRQIKGERCQWIRRRELELQRRRWRVWKYLCSCGPLRASWRDRQLLRRIFSAVERGTHARYQAWGPRLRQGVAIARRRNWRDGWQLTARPGLGRQGERGSGRKSATADGLRRRKRRDER